MSRLGNLIPLILLFLVVGGAAYVGYQIYLWSNEMSDRGKKHMEKKHMSFTKEGGLKVGVKELRGENYEDKTQHALVNMWNTSSEARKSSRPGDSRTTSSSSRPSGSRTTSAQPASGASPATSPPPTQRTESSKSNSSVPGGW